MRTSIVASVLLGLAALAAANPQIPDNEIAIPDAGTQNILDDLIIEILNAFKESMPVGYPGLGIPPLDPMEVAGIELDIQDPLLKIKGSLSDIHVDGLSTFDLAHLKSNLILLTLEMGLELPTFSINGHYDIDGVAGLILPIYGKGPFSITVSGIQLLGGSKLAIIFGGFKVKDLHYNLSLTEINVKFEGLLGGGEFGDVINDIITSLGVQIFNMIEPVIHDSLVEAITEVLNYALGPKHIAPDAKLNPAFPISLHTPNNRKNQLLADAGTYVDQVLANLRQQMIMTGMDRIELPDNSLEFSQVILGVRWHGQASLYSGVLRGIETIHRPGPADLVLEPNGDIVFSAELAVNDAKLFYSMLVKFMGLGPTASVTGSLKRVKVVIQCRVAAGLSAVTLEKLDIKDLGYLSIDVSGLGLILNFLTEIVSEFLGNFIKGFVANVLEVPVKSMLNTIIAGTLFPSTPMVAGSNNVVVNSIPISIKA